MKKLVEGLERNGFAVTSELEMRLINLARKLPERGKKAFQFLPENVKQDVLAIVDLIEKEPEISALYEKWKTHQTELNRIYKNDENFIFPKLSKNESFRPVLNAVVKEAWAIRKWLDSQSRDIEERQSKSAFEIKRCYDEIPKPISEAYRNIIAELSKCYSGGLNSPVKHFDITMDSKYQEEQRQLKKRLGISV